MMNVKVTAKTVRIEIDKAVHVFARHALLGVILEDVTGPDTVQYAPGVPPQTLAATPMGKVSIGLAGGSAIGAMMSLDEARRLVDLLTQAMEGDDE